MQFALDSTLDLLDRTPATLTTLLGGLGGGWTTGNEGPQTWSPYDVVSHLLHGEHTDWVPRVRIILEHGAARTFDPYVMDGMYEMRQGKDLAQLLAEFAALRADNVAAVRALKLTPQQLELTGMHPRLGVVRLRELLSTWAVHDLNHLYQIARAMAHQYRDEVGPWNYLRVFGERQA